MGIRSHLPTKSWTFYGHLSSSVDPELPSFANSNEGLDLISSAGSLLAQEPCAENQETFGHKAAKGHGHW